MFGCLFPQDRWLSCVIVLRTVIINAVIVENFTSLVLICKIEDNIYFCMVMLSSREDEILLVKVKHFKVRRFKIVMSLLFQRVPQTHSEIA
jgi:hypothetical protein